MHGSCINFHFLSIHVYFSRRDNLIQNLSLQCKRKEKSHCHGSKISGSQQSVVLPIWWEKKQQQKNVLCIITLRNERVAGIFLPSFDNTIGRPSLKGRLLLRSRNLASLVAWRNTSPLYRSNILWFLWQ